MLAIIVDTTAAAAGWPPVKRRFAANSGLFPFRFRRGMRKGRGHLKPLWRSDYTTSSWTQPHLKGMAFFSQVITLCGCRGGWTSQDQQTLCVRDDHPG